LFSKHIDCIIQCILIKQSAKGIKIKGHSGGD
jgi:hypothetical protein